MTPAPRRPALLLPRTLPALVLLEALLLLGPSAALAGGFHISILGARRTGMMTNLGNPDDVTALFHNPAGLADQPGTRVHLSSGLTFLDNSLSLQALDPKRFPEVNPDGCGKEGAAPCPWPIDEKGYYEANIEPERYLGITPYLGFSQDLSKFAPGQDRLVISFATYAPGAYGAFLPEDAPTAYFVTEGLFLVVAATAGVGWRINDWLAVGGSLSYNHLRLQYSQKFSMADAITPAGETPGLEAFFAQAYLGDLQMTYRGSDHGMGWGLGALITPWPWLGIGMSYFGSTSAAFTGELELRSLGSSYADALGYEKIERDDSALRKEITSYHYKLPEELEVEMPIPPALQIGASFRPTAWLELGVDLRWWLYSIFEKQTIRPIYADDPPGLEQPLKEPMTEDSLSHDKDYSDSYELAGGVLVRPLGVEVPLELMFGVGYDRSPVPDRSFAIDNPSMNQVLFTGGLRYTVARHWRLGLAYMMINYLERDVTDSETSPPTNVRIQGRAHIPTLELEYLE